MQIPGHLAICPGYVDAVIRENEIRDAAMLNLNTRVCGVEIQQMTLRHWIILDGINSPLLTAANPTPVDVVKFLWVLSPKFNPRQWSWAKWFFIRHCRNIPYGESVVKIRKFIDETFQDSPPSTSDKWQSPQVSFAANLIFSVASKFHWTRETILHLPLKETFQHVKMIRMSNEAASGEHPVGWNPSDAILSRERRRLREEKLLDRARQQFVNLLANRTHN